MSSHATKTSVKVWIDAVTEATQQRKLNQRKSNEPRSRKPNPSPVSQPLGPTTHNPRPAKRSSEKAASRVNPGRACKRLKRMANSSQDNALMDDEAGYKSGRRGRGRGRPPGPGRASIRAATAEARGRRKGQSPVEEVTEDLSNMVPSTIFEPPSLGSGPRSRTTSPTKSPSKASRAKMFADAKKDSTIDMTYLEGCTPSIKLRTLETARKSGDVPQPVMDLYISLVDTPGGIIPLALKHRYEEDSLTPRKSRQPPFAGQYLPQQDGSIPPSCQEGAKAVIDQAVRNAERNHREGAHEGQWRTTVVTPLINEVLRWPQGLGVRLLSVENCAIEPSDIRMLRPGECSPADESSKGKGKETEADKTWKDLSTVRMVDCSLGLFLDEPVCDLISKAFRNINDYEQSLNQSMSYIRHTPLLLDFELKKTNQARDPQVQLAIWLAAAYLKRKHHGWNTSIPMPGLVVNGHEWNFYIAFERDNGLILIGPERFGSTAKIASTWEILYRLNILVQWGVGKYQDWFNEQVLSWARKLAGENY
ncbi:MAG: hypothetical protein Q9207_003407 [Kuettlingeria erythrocarpa]